MSSQILLPASLPTLHCSLPTIQSLRRESNSRGRHTKTAGFRYNTEASQWAVESGQWTEAVIRRSVFNCTLPTLHCPLFQSAQWESNPHVRHGKAIGYRYIMGALEPVEAVGIEPTSPA